MPREDIKQVELDIKRTHLSNEEQQRVLGLITEFLTAHPSFHYYQGYHDIALNCRTTAQLEFLSLHNVRDFMAASMVPTLAVLELVPELIAQMDRELGALIGNAPAHYALSSIMTLFCHDLDWQGDKETANVRARDVLHSVQTNGLLYVIYLYACLVVQNKQHVMDALQQDCEPEIVHAVLSKIGSRLHSADMHKLDLLVTESRTKFPIRRTGAWKHISRYSVLKSGHLSKRNAVFALGKLEKSKTHGRVRVRLMMALMVAVIGVMLHRRQF